MYGSNVFYSDTNVVYYNLTPDTVSLLIFVNGFAATDRGNTTEVWVSWYKLAFYYMSWICWNGLIIHITDAHAHGINYTFVNKYSSKGSRLDVL